MSHKCAVAVAVARRRQRSRPRRNPVLRRSPGSSSDRVPEGHLAQPPVRPFNVADVRHTQRHVGCSARDGTGGEGRGHGQPDPCRVRTAVTRSPQMPARSSQCGSLPRAEGFLVQASVTRPSSRDLRARSGGQALAQHPRGVRWARQPSGVLTRLNGVAQHPAGLGRAPSQQAVPPHQMRRFPVTGPDELDDAAPRRRANPNCPLPSVSSSKAARAPARRQGSPRLEVGLALVALGVVIAALSLAALLFASDGPLDPRSSPLDPRSSPGSAGVAPPTQLLTVGRAGPTEAATWTGTSSRPGNGRAAAPEHP